MVNAELPTVAVAVAADGADAALGVEHRQELVMGDAELALALAAHDLRPFALRTLGVVLGAVLVPAAAQLRFGAVRHLTAALLLAATLAGSLHVMEDHATYAARVIGCPAVVALALAPAEPLAACHAVSVGGSAGVADLIRAATKDAPAFGALALCTLIHVGAPQ
jgi:hypothetical protein